MAAQTCGSHEVGIHILGSVLPDGITPVHPDMGVTMAGSRYGSTS